MMVWFMGAKTMVRGLQGNILSIFVLRTHVTIVLAGSGTSLYLEEDVLACSDPVPRIWI
jgi:hypothetical protein